MDAQCHLVLESRPEAFQRTEGRYSPVSAKVLTQRLRELEERGVVIRNVLPTSPPSVEYQLTPLGLELVPAIAAIVSVAEKLKRTQEGRALLGAETQEPVEA